MAKIFIICPVRNVYPAIREAVHRYVDRLEDGGHEVHWPQRDTDQSDTHGIYICIANCDAIIDADEVHIWFDLESSGTKFDLGMLFALLRLGCQKKLVLINKVSYTEGKSFENILRAIAKGFPLARKDLEGTVLAF